MEHYSLSFSLSKRWADGEIQEEQMRYANRERKNRVRFLTRECLPTFGLRKVSTRDKQAHSTN